MKWKPKIGEMYYMPWLADYKVDYVMLAWNDSSWDEEQYTAGFVCRTKEEAIELAEKMLAVAKGREQSD